LIRVGLYFPPEQFFFAFIYMLNHRQAERRMRERAGAVLTAATAN
jgi:hypothetical protein